MAIWILKLSFIENPLMPRWIVLNFTSLTMNPEHLLKLLNQLLFLYKLPDWSPVAVLLHAAIIYFYYVGRWESLNGSNQLVILSQAKWMFMKRNHICREIRKNISQNSCWQLMTTEHLTMANFNSKSSDTLAKGTAVTQICRKWTVLKEHVDCVIFSLSHYFCYIMMSKCTRCSAVLPACSVPHGCHICWSKIRKGIRTTT